MTARKQSKGTCSYCGNIYAKGGMKRHLDACSARKEAIANAEASGRASDSLIHLRVEDLWDTDFWLDLEIRASATFEDLDFYLRAIWLECCGHLSEFKHSKGRSEEIPMSLPIGKGMSSSSDIIHIYDFGTSSETRIRGVNARKGVPTTEHPIALMARNLLPEIPCRECERPATWLCMECIVEHDMQGTLCDKHVKTHPHQDDYGSPIPIVNSPRVGMCGYTGPAEPPY